MIVTDAWKPQVNGVVRTLATLRGELEMMGHVVDIIGPDRFRTFPCPTYPEIRLAVFARRRLAKLINDFRPDALHIATEGPLGMAARAWAKRNNATFTTSFHTRFPEYVSARMPIPESFTYGVMRRFHNAGSGTMVATASLRAELTRRGFERVLDWTRGVDLALFHPDAPDELREWDSLPRPVFSYIGRVAPEKNLAAFLKLDLPGSKVVVGDGPALAGLRRAFPGVHFAGARFGEELRRSYTGSDVFVFPSLTDTFGLVLLEALACGTPVAAYPVTGPIDVLSGAAPGVGAVDNDLRTACLTALERGERGVARAHAELFSWRHCAAMFRGNLTQLTAADITD